MTQTGHLYETFQPEHYDLNIDINRAKKLIAGTSTITGIATEQMIAVNQKYLTIESITMDNQELTFEVDDAAELVRINLPRTGKVTVLIAYSAKLTDTMMGI